MSSALPDAPASDNEAGGRPRVARREFVRGSLASLVTLACARPVCAAATETDRAAWNEFLRRPWERPARLDRWAGRHPRLFLTSDRIDRLREAAGSSHAAIWAMVREKAEAYRDRPPPADFERQQDMREAGRGIPWQALTFLVGGDPAHLANVKRWILTLCGYPRWEINHSLAGGECLFGVALGYDWLYSHFTDDERALVRTKLAAQARAMRDGPPVHHDVWLANHNHVEHTGLAAAGFALFDEVPDAAGWIRQADLVYREFLHQASDDGSSTEGHQYWAYTTESALRYFELARDLLGTNYYDHPWLRRVAQFILHSTLPDFNSTQCVMTFGDAGRSFNSHGPTHLLYRVAAEYRDRHAQWLALEMDRRGVGRGDFCTWANLLWYDPSLAPEPISRQPGLGRSEDIGWVTDRSNWSADAVMVGFKCGPMHGHKAQTLYDRQFREQRGSFKSIGGGHGHPDVNSFQIYAHGKWLAIDPGYERPKQTRTHSTLLINGHGQLGEGQTWFDRDAVLAAGAKSALIRCEVQPTHDYLVGDAMNIYPAAAGVTRIHRHFLYLKPDLVVVLDDLRFTRGASVDWLLHTEREWRTTAGGAFVAVNDDVEMDVQFLPATPGRATIDRRALVFSVKAGETARIVAVLHPRRQGNPSMRAQLLPPAGPSLGLAIEAGPRRLRVEIDPLAQRVTVT